MLWCARVFIVSVLLLSVPSAAWAHGIIGPRFFPEPVVTEDAFPADEGHLKFHHHNTAEGREQEAEAELSKRLTPNLSLGVEWEQRSLSPNDPDAQSASGFRNPEITLKYAMFRSPEHEAIVTSGLSLETGNVGKREVGAEFDPEIAPRLFFGKGLGDLPDALRYLRPLAVGGDLGFAVPLTASAEGKETRSTFRSRFYLQYSLLYLQTVVKDVGLTWPFNRLFPMTEVSLRGAANGPTRGRTEATVHPGLLWAGRYVEVGVVADLPLNQEAEVRGGVSAILHFFLDDLAPRVFRPIVQ